MAAATEDARSLIARFDEAGYDASWLEGIFDGGAIVRINSAPLFAATRRSSPAR
jgi:hypothetical protein